MTKIRVDIKRMMLLPATLMTLTAAGQNVSGQVVDAHGDGIPYIMWWPCRCLIRFMLRVL